MNPYLYFPRDGSFSGFREEILAENVIAVDTETTGLDPNSDSLRLIQIAVFGKPVFVLDMLLCDDADRNAVAEILMAPSIKIFQNAKFDIQFLYASGFETGGRIFDTMLAAQLLKTPEGPARFGLDSISSFFLGAAVSKEEQTSGFDGELREAQIEYSARDASVLLELRSVMAPALVSNGLADIASIEFQCTRAVAEIESFGILLDIDRWNILTDETREICGQAESRLFKHAGSRIVQPDFFGSETTIGINLNSNKQVLDLLHDNGINVADTSKAALSPYRNEPLVRDLQEYRKATKMLGGFLEPMPSFINPATGRIHANYSQIGASSGRMSCWGPNMQQIPRDASFRECFIPSTGNSLVIADYSQIELRVAAQIARDEMMIEAYRNGGDLHKLTASLITGTPIESVTKKQRQAAKAVNFGLIFAMGARG
ncbi:MAG: DNA polymerase, partial [Clostridia bacterium]